MAPALLVIVLALAAAIGAAAGPARSAPPPGMNTLFFSPSGSGGCGGGSISSLGEASAGQGQSPTIPTVVNGGGQQVWLPDGTGGQALANFDGPYASGMAATSWNYSFGYPWSEVGPLAPAGGTEPAWSTLVYFTISNCGKPQDMSNFLMAQCIQSNEGLVPPHPQGSCNALNPCRGPGCPDTSPTPAWGAYTTLGASGSATSFVGSGLAMDTTRRILYFTTAPNDCTGDSTCSVSVWSSPAATQYGQRLSPTLVATIPGITSPSYMAVDPIGQTLYLTGKDEADVISVPAAGGPVSTVLSGGDWLSGDLVTGMAFDASTGVLYVMSPMTGDEPNKIVQVPVGSSPSVLFGPGTLPGNDPVATDAEAKSLAVDPANAVLAWGALAHGTTAQGTANMIAYGLLDGGPSSGPGSQTYGWTGAPDATHAANIWSMTFAGGVGTRQYQGATYPCPTTTVAASGATARAVADSTVMIPMRAYRVAPDGPAPPAQATEHSGTTSTTVRGPMVVAFRDRRSGRTLATVRPGFTLRANTRGLRRVTIPAAAREAARTGRLELRVRSRNAGTGQRWRTRTLRVLAR